MMKYETWTSNETSLKYIRNKIETCSILTDLSLKVSYLTFCSIGLNFLFKNIKNEFQLIIDVQFNDDTHLKIN